MMRQLYRVGKTANCRSSIDHYSFKAWTICAEHPGRSRHQPGLNRLRIKLSVRSRLRP